MSDELEEIWEEMVMFCPNIYIWRDWRKSEKFQHLFKIQMWQTLMMSLVLALCYSVQLIPWGCGNWKVCHDYKDPQFGSSKSSFIPEQHISCRFIAMLPSQLMLCTSLLRVFKPVIPKYGGLYHHLILQSNQSNLSNSKLKGPPKKKIELSKNLNYGSYVVSI